MRNFAVTISLLILLCIPALANDRPTELTGGFTIVNTDGPGDVFALDLRLEFPVSKRFQIGPVLRISDIDVVTESTLQPPIDAVRTDGTPPIQPTTITTESLDAWSIGAVVTLNFSEGADGPYGSLSAVTLEGDGEGYLVTPEVGIKFGADRAFVRVGARYAFSVDEGELVDLEGLEVVGAIGLRW